MSKKYTNRLKEQQRIQRKRKYTLGAVIAAALLVVVVVILLGMPEKVAGDFKTVEPKAWPSANGKSLGPENATVVVTEFADYQCPYCKLFHDDVAERIIADYVETGKIRYEYRHFIVIDGNVGGNESRRAAQASECAVEQGRFWDYYNILYVNQGAEGSGAYSDVRLKAFAESIGLDTADFNSCLSSARAGQQVSADERLATSYGINSTPSLLVNGVKIDNPMEYNQVKAAIDAALNQ